MTILRCLIPQILSETQALNDQLDSTGRADNKIIVLWADHGCQLADRPSIMILLNDNHAVRSQRWRYKRYCDGTEELYDHDNDPWEWTNLAGDKEHEDIITEHIE